ncbi:hypothetical protein V498_06614 [Pseudogymnoascus sp. VKM F-4517 (FW-2822)]|nr:hypothetical protein V498_06614 [Pseudogymnoascus sp. VKM F-4517 (FW-2822)]
MDRFRRRPVVAASSPGDTGHIGQTIIGALQRISLSRKTSSKIEEVPDLPQDIKGPLGLNLIHGIPKPLIDFIFVHGLGGGSRKTWSVSPDPRHYWPKEWLPQDPDFKNVRIHSFGYKADWDERKESTLTVHDFARSLLNEVQCSPDIRGSNTKIVFVAHSMGGIVIKKAYLLAREDPELRELAHRIHSLYFLATPHGGSQLAKTLSNILQISFGPVSYGAKPFVAELNRTSETIISINDSFRHFVGDLQLWSFYETTPSTIIGVDTMIVDKSSATLGYAKEHSSLLNADHRDSQVASDALESQLEQLIKFTGVTESPIGELSTLENIRVAGSGMWLLSSEAYLSWRTDNDAKRRIFCLTAKPGSGKSVLSSQVISDLQDHELRYCYYFFKRGNATKSNISGCLLSLAYQMARYDSTILKKLCEIEQEATSWEQWDERMIWRKLFLGCIFKYHDSHIHFWVIDALDECHMLPLVLSLFAEIPQHLRIFITSCKSSELENGLVKIAHFTEHYQVKATDTLQDLEIYIDSKMYLLPAGDENGQENLKQRILAKASGSFLWVYLVVRELQEAYSEESAEDILSELSTDMNEFYAGMLETVSNKGIRTTTLAKAVFMWALLSSRPLRVDELQFVIKLDINQTVHNLGKSISAVCGQLLSVNQKDEVEAIHQTAKAFMLQQDRWHNLELEQINSHTRMAQICLKILAEDKEHWRSARELSKSIIGVKFMEYACELSAKFGPNLHISPSSIRHIIPEMCPLESLISKTYRSIQPGLCVKGKLDKVWDDCLIRFNYPTHKTIAVAYGEHHVAVAASDGTIFIYDKGSNYDKFILNHGERPRTIAFSSDGEYMASSGLRKVRVWSTTKRTQVWSFDTEHEALTLLFINDNTALVAATKGNTAIFPNPRQIPRKALFSPDYTVLAVDYRGLPLYLFAVQAKKFIGCCSREDINSSGNPTDFADYSVVDALAFNPNPEMNSLVVSYGFGELALYDTRSSDVCFQISGVYAHHLACSPNGRKLITGSAGGTIRIFEFVGARGEALSLVYKHCPYEDEDDIQGIIFSSDSLSFAFSAPPLEAEVIGMCFHPDGDFVFCGKQNGAVTYFESATAAQRGILYCHSANVRIVCIAYIKETSLLITGDDAGRVLLKNINVSRLECTTGPQIAEIRLKNPPLAILAAPSGSRILLRSRISVEVWTINAGKIGTTKYYDGGNKTTIVNHPALTEYFIIIDHKSMLLCSWTNSHQAKLSTDEIAQASNFTVTRSSQALQHPV